jgi:hypothetical protein
MKIVTYILEVLIMFAKELVHDGHVRRFSVSDAGQEGWEVRVEEDAAVVRRLCYTDWHRVERALGSITLEVQALVSNGWQDRTAH